MVKARASMCSSANLIEMFKLLKELYCGRSSTTSRKNLASRKVIIGGAQQVRILHNRAWYFHIAFMVVRVLMTSQMHW